ncbi:hypothetical protein MUK42_13190 [Musa troglodytarum]|uniref:Uncharacterized protein n=1 Tax=Musa troglodytarum TaxID=320322 RepID=A0A9E7KUI3_9LILI|nr:hypothetical protein MUK42_13190 [Musa troglodytarum]
MAKDAILGFLQADDEITDSHEFAAAHEVDHTELKNVIKGLNGFEGVEANPFQSPNPGNLRRTIIVLAKRGNCMRLKDSQTSTSSWPYLRRGFPWKMLRQDWIPRFSVLGHHGLKRMIEVRLPRDLYLERNGWTLGTLACSPLKWCSLCMGFPLRAKIWAMDIQHHQRERVKTASEGNKAGVVPPPPPPSSAAASPSHEFSFTISFHPPLSSAPKTLKSSKATATSAVDLAPADDIFLHGHLLPLHLLPSPTSPPRPSDITFENLGLTVDHADADRGQKHEAVVDHEGGGGKNREKAKGRSLSSFFGFGRLRRRNSDGEKEEDLKKKPQKKKRGFHVSRLLRKYARIVEPLFFFRSEKEKPDLHRRPYSFSGHSTGREREGWRSKAQLSAPDSTATSRTNSGLLSATSMAFSSSDNSTMEELQSAIQAAIAHCKNSIASKQEMHVNAATRFIFFLKSHTPYEIIEFAGNKNKGHE